MDFTLKAYREYLLSIKKNYPHILRFDEYMLDQNKFDNFCLIRHDVDRKPHYALRMAQLENELGMKSTYYFRDKSFVYDEAIIKKISELGHEIGYHYECLSDTRGDIPKAVEIFQKTLEKFRKNVPVKTISMHGRPLLKFDNRDIWKDEKNHQRLIHDFKILGEVYLDIDYSDILYISDTGRNWTSDRANVRDKTNSKIKIEFSSQSDLLNYLSNKPHPKMVFQIHPERWSNNFFAWTWQLMFDSGINFLKKILN